MPSTPTLAGRLRERFFPSAANEFKRLHFLHKKNLPAVTPLALGQCGSRSVLVTQEEPNVCSIQDLLAQKSRCGEKISDQLITDWAKFFNLMLANRLYIADFHTGNLLYSSAKKSFVIVDPFDMKRPWYLKKVRVLRMLKRQLSMILEFYTQRELMLFLSVIEPRATEKFHAEFLEYCAYYARELQLPKRLKRFRKNRLIIDGIQRKSPFLCPQDIENAVIRELSETAANEVWERDYVCSLHYLPILHTVAKIPDSGKIYIQKAGSAAADEKIKTEILARLKICAISADDFAFGTDRHGRTVLIDKSVL